MKKLLDIIFLCAVIFFIHNSAMAKDIKFIQMTDLYLMPDEESIANYKRAIEQINKTKNLDFVVFTGDNIGRANEPLLELFISMSRQIKVPYYVEIGDKDCFRNAGLNKELYLKYYNSHKLINRQKSFNYTIKDGDYLYVFADGVKQHMPSKNGYYREETVTWLDKVLTKNKNKTVIIFQHFPLFDLRENSASNLYRPDIYADMLKKHKNVLAIFSGHYQENFEGMSEDGSINYFVTEPAKNGNSSYREVNIADMGNKKYEIYSRIVKF